MKRQSRIADPVSEVSKNNYDDTYSSLDKDRKSRGLYKSFSLKRRMARIWTFRYLTLFMLYKYYCYLLVNFPKDIPNEQKPRHKVIISNEKQDMLKINVTALPNQQATELLSIIADNHNYNACIVQQKGSHSCHFYPCKSHPNGKIINVTINTKLNEEQPFGYAGKFLYRMNNLTRTMMPVSGSGWASGCAISHQYKFVYIHVLKSGGTATKDFIRKSLCGEDDPECKRVDMYIVKPIACKTAVFKYPDYFFFSFVRNPFSRIYSMYSMSEGYPPMAIRETAKWKRIGHKRRKHIWFNIPAQHEKYHYHNHQRRLTSSVSPLDNYTFDEFVLNRKERKMHTSMSEDHYIMQTKFLFGENNCPSVDFLGRVEYMDKDMKTILDIIKSQEMKDFFEKSGNVVQPVNTWGSSNKEIRLGGNLKTAYLSHDVVEEVVKTYERDFQLLGYDMGTIPNH